MAEVCCAGRVTRVAFVSGATGFVGGHLVRRLQADGWTVHAIVRRSPGDATLERLAEVATTHFHDGSTASLSQVVAGIRPDVVFHLASRFVAEHSADDVESLVRDNLLFGTQLLDAMRVAGVKSLVNVGSAWQHYGNATYAPASLYAATKQAFADLAAYYVVACGLRITTVEFTDTYGPGDTRRKLIPIMCEAERTGVELAMVGEEMMLDFVHVSDAVEALLVAAQRVRKAGDSNSETFAVRSDAPVSVVQLFDLWEQARGKRVAARFGAREYRRREMLEPWTQGETLPGWAPVISLPQGLRTL